MTLPGPDGRSRWPVQMDGSWLRTYPRSVYPKWTILKKLFTDGGDLLLRSWRATKPPTWIPTKTTTMRNEASTNRTEAGMRRGTKNLFKGEGGFTLVEMVVVIAIMGVIAAVAVPMVNNTLGRSKERAYDADMAMIQTTVEAYYTASDNTRFGGQRQYPIRGFNSGTDLNEDIDRTDESLNDWDATDTATDLSTPLNPFRGVRGGEPMWRDGADGDGERGEENLNGEKASLDSTGAGWFVDKVELNSVEYAVDTRDYFIDFTKLVVDGLLKEVPAFRFAGQRGWQRTGIL